MLSDQCGVRDLCEIGPGEEKERPGQVWRCLESSPRPKQVAPHVKSPAQWGSARGVPRTMPLKSRPSIRFRELLVGQLSFSPLTYMLDDFCYHSRPPSLRRHVLQNL